MFVVTMMYLVCLTEHTPTKDGTDLHSTHFKATSLIEVARMLEDYEINFGCPVVISIVPFN